MNNRMELSLLKQIQTYVIKYANVISEVLNIDIEIVDDSLVRIAGTGVFSSEIDSYCKGMSYKKVLESGEYSVITNPTADSCCEYCELKNCCKEVLEIATPIFYNESIIGVIGLICLDENQKNRILKNVDENLRFLDNIAELISSKAYEEFQVKSENEVSLILDKFINVVDTGIVFLSESNKIYDLNSAAIKELELSEEYNNMAGNLGDAKSMTFDIEKYKDRGIEIPINVGKYKEVFVFNNKKSKVQNTILEEMKKSNNTETTRLLGESEPMIKIKDKIKRIATSNSTVLITGESGTGKDVLARTIHDLGSRKDKPFIAINCAAIPESLLESELFGYVKGAFSGANTQGRMGKFELANGGVIFLDEIGDMPLHLQVKILRVIQDRRCIRIGSNKVIDLDVRIIAATNKNLKKQIEEGKFREDLYYRLNVIPVELPPLRDRDGDVLMLMDSFIDRYNKSLNIEKKEITSKALDKIKKYNWPGNIRELENCVEYMVNISRYDDVISEEFLPEAIKNYNKVSEIPTLVNDELTLNQLEKKYIESMMDKYGDDLKAKKIIADKLGIGIATLYRKIDKERRTKEF